MNRTAGHASIGQRPNIAGAADGARRTRINALDIWAFVLPALSFFEITLVGRLIVTELLLFALLPWLWSAPDRLPMPRWFVVLWAGWLLGQVVSDVVVGSEFEDYARGWAAIVLTMTNFAAILVLASTPRRARLFALGLAVGGSLAYLFVPNTYAVDDPWKWAFALPIGFALTAGLSGKAGARLPWLTVAALAGFGALNLIFGYRSLGGVSLLAAGYFAIAALLGRRGSAPVRSAGKALAGLALLAVVVVGVLELYDSASAAGILGSAQQEKHAQQSGDLGVLVGGRDATLGSIPAIIDSPFLGHGSWAKNPKYAEIVADLREALGYGAQPRDVLLIPTHSYFLGAWVWAGILGATFWLAVLIIAVWLLANLWTGRLELAPLLAFSTFFLVWNIPFSPYGLTARLATAFAIVLVLLGLRMLQPRDAESRAPQPFEGPTRYVVSGPRRPPPGGVIENYGPAPRNHRGSRS